MGEWRWATLSRTLRAMDWRPVMMYKILFAAAVAVAVSAMLGWIAALQDAANSAYNLVYGHPPAHPHGDTTQHLNDWLAFLPDDPMTRGVIAAGAIPRLLGLRF